jgi:hypothetical protein
LPRTDAGLVCVPEGLAASACVCVFGGHTRGFCWTTVGAVGPGGPGQANGAHTGSLATIAKCPRSFDGSEPSNGPGRSLARAGFDSVVGAVGCRVSVRPERRAVGNVRRCSPVDLQRSNCMVGDHRAGEYRRIPCRWMPTVAWDAVWPECIAGRHAVGDSVGHHLVKRWRPCRWMPTAASDAVWRISSISRSAEPTREGVAG